MKVVAVGVVAVCLFAGGFAAGCRGSSRARVGDTETVTVRGHTFTGVKIGTIKIPSWTQSVTIVVGRPAKGRLDTRLYVPGVFGPDEVGLRYKPAKLIYTGDGSSYLERLKYRSYGRSRAVAVGVDEVDDCDPSCATGSYHPVPARLTFSRRAECRGKRVYTKLRIAAPGARRYGKIDPFTVDLRYMAGCPPR